MKRFGLADGLGIVAALVALAWMPALFDPFTPVKLLALAAGGACLAPAVIARWRAIGRPTSSMLIPCAAAVLILLWGVISIVATGAPLWDSMFGWWGRGDGWLACFGAAVLLVGAATLSMREVARTITWLLAGATVGALVGLLQFAGVSIAPGIGGPVVGLNGNIDFAAAYFAILAMLALGRSVSSAPRWQRIWGGILFLVLAFLAWRTTALQGPAALGAGLAAFLVVGALLYRGAHRRAGLIAAAAITLIGATAVIMFAFASGPFAGLWDDGGFKGRQVYWDAAVRTMAGEPLFGTGPSGFARYISEYRPETYISAAGPTMRVSATHNIALQFGATLGLPGLALWLVAFVGSAAALAVRIARRPVASIGLTASVAGALATYLVQGMVSIDMLPLLATGWLVAGLALACSREPTHTEQGAGASSPQAPVRSSRSRARGDAVPTSTSLWVPITGGLLGLAVALLVSTQISFNQRLLAGIAPQEGLVLVTDRMVPCAIRSDFAGRLPDALPLQIAGTAIVQAAELDRRCPTMVQLAAEVAVRQQVLTLAETYTADAVRLDPMLDSSWVLRGRYFIGAGDLASAEAAAREARRLQALYPERFVTPREIAAITALEQLVQRAKEQSK